MTSLDTSYEPGGRPFTGRAFLLVMILGFGAVFAVNFVMAYFAITTFNGVETESSYAAGKHFMKDMAAIKDQDARKWQVAAHVGALSGSGGIDVSTQFRDAAGVPLKDINVVAAFEHPTNRYRDRAIPLVPGGGGTFAGHAEGMKPGGWTLRLTATGANGEHLFTSRNRVTLAP